MFSLSFTPNSDFLLSLLIGSVGIWAATHALIYKRNPGAAFSWIIVTLFVPVIGPMFYYAFGINRIRRKASQLKAATHLHEPSLRIKTPHISSFREVTPPFRPLCKLAEAITHQPLLSGNHVQALHNGEETYPAMLADIQQAQKSLYLSSYIFDTDPLGREFIQALTAAQQRGVEIKVLLDSFGETFQFPRASTLLRRNRVPTACFLPIFPIMRINLRNHRKILIIDQKIAYTGGMNISQRHMADNKKNRHRVIDLHFRFTGPIVWQIQQTFSSDWHFTTGEHIKTEKQAPPASGEILCRALADGPDNDIDLFIETLNSAFSTAKKRICLITPYFIPPPILIASLNAAALRGIEVEILLPSKNDLPYIGWATRRILWELLRHGVKIYQHPPPFMHTKLVLVDQYYIQVGSVNLDTRSLRLNFELAVEIYNKKTGELLQEYFDQSIQHARRIQLLELENRPLLIKIRDAAAWLLSPYL